MSSFDAITQNIHQNIKTAHDAIVADAQGDTTDPEVLLQMKYDIDKYSTTMQFALGIENSMQGVRKAFVQAIGQA